MATLKNTTINDTGYIQLPVGNTIQRPASPASGYMRINSDTGQIEMYAGGSGWSGLFSLVPFAATGGTVTTSGIYKSHTFTSSGTFTVTSALSGTNVDIMVVAGGGAGGWDVGGGGGAGGLIYNIAYTGFSATSYAITIGAGASPSGGGGGTAPSGSNTTVGSLLTATGGGGGGNYSGGNGAAGGSGGGGSGYGYTTTGGAGTPGQGFAGGVGISGYGQSATGAGGGGYSSVGADSANNRSGYANGGLGIILALDGNSVTYSTGGKGGGDDWRDNQPGAANTGNGGDGAGSATGSAGGSGIVIIRYKYQ